MNADVFKTMFDNDEMWYVWEDGNAIIIYDLPVLDC